MSQEDPTSDNARERRRLPITPMRPYVEPEQAPPPKVTERLKARLGHEARVFVEILRDILDPHTQQRDE